MNSKQQAKKGFKTFLLTLVISLIVFSGIYYVINSQEDDGSNDAANQEGVVEYQDVLGSESDNSQENTSNDESVFADLANQQMEKGEQREVLAGADSADTTETAVVTTTTSTTQDTTEVATTVSESTVPDTGVSGPTMGLVMTLIILGFAGYIMFLGPRNVALHNFERDTIDDL